MAPLCSSFQVLSLSAPRAVAVAHRAAPARRTARFEVVARAKEAGCGVMGTKAGMTTVFTEDGLALPCTVIALEEGNVVSQVKTKDSDGYNAVQIAYQPMKEKNLSKPEAGHLKKAGLPALRHLTEFKLDSVDGFEVGKKLDVAAMFAVGSHVDVAGVSTGKGFQGGIKRWNMSRGLMSHGSKSHRGPGSIGLRMSGDGGRVQPGLRMPGRMGNERVKARKLQVVKVDLEKGALVVKGSVPGKPGNVLTITPAKVVGENC